MALQSTIFYGNYQKTVICRLQSLAISAMLVTFLTHHCTLEPRYALMIYTNVHCFLLKEPESCTNVWDVRNDRIGIFEKIVGGPNFFFLPSILCKYVFATSSESLR